MYKDTILLKHFLDAEAPHNLHRATSGTSGTFQQTTAARLNKLHCLVSAQDVFVLQGTGASVTATSGMLWPANTPLYFLPKTGKESLGYAAADGSTAFSATAPLTIGVVETSA